MSCGLVDNDDEGPKSKPAASACEPRHVLSMPISAFMVVFVFVPRCKLRPPPVPQLRKQTRALGEELQCASVLRLD